MNIFMYLSLYILLFMISYILYNSYLYTMVTIVIY